MYLDAVVGIFVSLIRPISGYTSLRDLDSFRIAGTIPMQILLIVGFFFSDLSQDSWLPHCQLDQCDSSDALFKGIYWHNTRLFQP